MFPQPAGGRKYFPRVYWILKHRFLCYRNKQTFFDGKNVLTVMVPILIDKDVFEPSYNDLKFTIQNRSYFCTNLILNYRRRQWQPTPVLLLGKSHGRRSLVGCSPWGRKESDTTEWLHFHFSLSCTGEGNGNPLQFSCLENPRDRGAWWAAIYVVAQSRTWLKQLGNSSSMTETSAPETVYKHSTKLFQKDF